MARLTAGTNVTLTKDAVADTLTIGAAGGGVNGPPLTKNRYHNIASILPGWGASTQSLVMANRLYAQVLPFANSVTIDTLSVQVQTAGAAGTLLRAGIYSVTADGLVNALLQDLGTKPADAAVVQTWTALAHAVTGPAYRALIVGSNGAPTLYRWATSSAASGFGLANTSRFAPEHTPYDDVIDASAALPATFGNDGYAASAVWFMPMYVV